MQSNNTLLKCSYDSVEVYIILYIEILHKIKTELFDFNVLEPKFPSGRHFYQLIVTHPCFKDLAMIVI